MLSIREFKSCWILEENGFAVGKWEEGWTLRRNIKVLLIIEFGTEVERNMLLSNPILCGTGGCLK